MHPGDISPGGLRLVRVRLLGLKPAGIGDERRPFFAVGLSPVGGSAAHEALEMLVKAAKGGIARLVGDLRDVHIRGAKQAAAAHHPQLMQKVQRACAHLGGKKPPEARVP